MVAKIKHIALWKVRVFLWILLIVAVTVAAGRFLFPSLSAYKPELEQLLTRQLGMEVRVGYLKTDWSQRLPRAELRSVEIMSPKGWQGMPLAELSRLELVLDPWQSILNTQPVFESVTVQDLSVTLSQKNGRWWPEGAAKTEAPSADSTASLRPLLTTLLSQKRLSMQRAAVQLLPERREAVVMTPVSLEMVRRQDQHQLTALLNIPALGNQSQQVLVMESENALSNPLQADYRFYLKMEHLGPQLFRASGIEHQWLPAVLDLNTEFWGQINAAGLEYLNGRLRMPQLAFSDERLPAFHNSGFDLAVLRSGENYQLQIQNFAIRTGDNALVVPQLVLTQPAEKLLSPPSHITVSELDLEKVNGWLQTQSYLPAGLLDTLADLKPAGSLKHLNISWPDQQWLDFEMVADLHRVQAEAWQGAPELKGVDGRLEVSRHGGRVDLNSNDFSMYFPELYDQGWKYTRADGVVRWFISPERVLVNSDLLRVRNDQVDGYGRFSIDIPMSEEPDNLTLMLGMRKSSGKQASDYVPAKAVGRELHSYLDGAIKEGGLNTGGFLYHGTTSSKKDYPDPVIQMFFDVDNAEFAFQPGWPHAFGSRNMIVVDNDQAWIDIENGKIFDTSIPHANVFLPTKDDRLFISGLTDGKAADVLRFLKDTPLREQVGDGFDEWALTGRSKAVVDLQIPLSQKEPLVNVISDLSDAQLSSSANDIVFDNLDGRVQYQSDKGLSAKGIKARFLGSPVKGAISSSEKGRRTRVSLDGSVAVVPLAEWLNVPIQKLLSGESGYKARLDICSQGKGCNRVLVESELKGIAANLPEPLGKKKEEARKFELVADMSQTQSTYRINYADQARSVFQLRDGLLHRAQLSFGGARPDLPADAGVWINGHLPLLDYDQVAELFEGYSENQSPEIAAEKSLKLVDLKLGLLKFRGVELESLALKVRPEAKRTSVQLSSPMLEGEILLPDDSSQPYLINFQRLSLEKGDDAADDTAGDLNDDFLKPEELPDMDLSVERLELSGSDAGKWQLKMRSDANGVRIQNIEGLMAPFRVTGEANWHLGEASGTDLTLKMVGTDMGKLFERFGASKVLESREMEAYMQLQWPTLPWQFSLDQLGGSFNFAAIDGSLLEAGPSGEALRIFGILNLNNFARRLKLDFSDLLQQGVAYDSLSASYRLSKGVATTQAPLRLKGPSTNMTMVGLLDLNHELVDKQLEVVLPLTSNVPLAAVLLGAPQVAAGAFIIDKLIGDQLEKVTTLKYRMHGDWGAPELDAINRATALENQSNGQHIPVEELR